MIDIKAFIKKYSEENALLREYLFFVISALFFNGGRYIIEFLAAIKLGPTEYGVWATMLLVITYFGNIHFGILNALNREIPFYRAKGDDCFVQTIKAAGLKTVVIMILLFFLCAMAYGGISHNKSVHIETLIALTLFFSALQVYQFFQNILRSEIMFNAASIQQGITGIIIVSITLPCLFIWKLNGLMVGYALSYLVGAFFLRGFDIVSILGIKINTQLLYRLIKIGFPIMIVGFLYAVITSVDRWMVVAWLGKEEMGYYSFAYNIFMGGMLFLNLLATQFYPRLCAIYGTSGSSIETMKLLWKQIKITAIIACGLSVFISLFLFNVCNALSNPTA